MENTKEPTTGGGGGLSTTPDLTVSGGHPNDVAADTDPSPHLIPAPKYRHEFYQSGNLVVVTIFAKGVEQDQLVVDLGVQTLHVVIALPGHEPYVLQQRLYGKIKVPECTHSVLSTKVEIKLPKAEAIHWRKLEYDPGVIAHSSSDNQHVTVKYPTSARKGPKDWDKLEADEIRKEKDEKLEGDAALNKLFQDIYKNADEDTRRAMNKSFVESNGTVLSTNWKEVGTKEVEKNPPEGIEMKKW